MPNIGVFLQRVGARFAPAVAAQPTVHVVPPSEGASVIQSAAWTASPYFLLADSALR